MIKHLYIRNFVLIDEVDLDFDPGFSAFTGETGAGKSILIDAISLLRAERANASFIRKGCREAIIEGTFDLRQDKHACQVLQDAGLEVNEETTFTRELKAGGKSTARIDRRIVTLSLLRDCLQYEVDIHGQRDNAYLLDPSTHIRLLDRYLQDEAEVKKTAEAYEAYDALIRERAKVLNDTYNENDLEYFRYEISEIEEADLKEGEDEELEEKEKSYRNVKDSLEKLNAIHQLYDGSVSEGLYDLNRLVQGLKSDEKIGKIQTEVNDAYYAVSDAMEQLNGLLDDMDLSEEDVNAMEERLFTIQKMKRKYGRTIPDILAVKEDLQKKVDAFSNRQKYLADMNGKIARAKAVYDKAAASLSKVRHDKAHLLDEAIEENLQELMLPNARFVTSITERKEPSRLGKDTVEFLISMNKGSDPKPLNRTASGGELSRLMLGLKVIFTGLRGIQTVIFDEIDTGVSGPVATAIGRRMKALSKTCQVFAVTHLAQVAACADQHYLVSKSSSGDATSSSVKLLDESERIDQLALISSGEITAISKRAAAELYRRNQK